MEYMRHKEKVLAGKGKGFNFGGLLKAFLEIPPAQPSVRFCDAFKLNQPIMGKIGKRKYHFLQKYFQSFLYPKKIKQPVKTKYLVP